MDKENKQPINWKDPEQVKEYRQKYYNENKEKFQKSVRKWIKNKGEYAKERRAAAMKKYYDLNREAHIERMRQYHKEHREEINRKSRERYARKKAEQQQQQTVDTDQDQ